MTDNRWTIGYAVAAESPTCETWRDTRLGGHPIWPPGTHPEVPACPLCNRPRLLLLQAFAPHLVHKDRVLLIFVCNSAVCSRQSQTWVAYRGFRWNEELEKEKSAKSSSSKKVDEINWDSSSESGSSTGGDLDELENMLKMQNLQLTENKPKKTHAQQPKSKQTAENGTMKSSKSRSNNSLFFRPHFVDVEFEPKRRDDFKKDSTDVERLLKVYETEEKQLQESGSSVTNWDAEDDAEETDEVVASDEFQSAIELAPEQVLRYKFGGKPVLWPRYPPPEVSAERCKDCNSSNVFEVQVLGTVLFYLEPEQAVTSSQREAALNFLAVALFTCEKDCQSSSAPEGESRFEYREVNVLVQTDIW